MGLKILPFGLFGCGKTAFAASMAEVCDIGVVDTESRWQYYSDPHPTAKPRHPSPAALKAGAPPLIYANPRRLRQDIPWLPKSDHIIWLVQTLDPTEAWSCRKIWATDSSIGGQVCDSASVIWDMLQDTRDTENEKLGGLSWAPVKRTDRKMLYTMLAAPTQQHFIACAHKQELMNKEMQVVDTRPWSEKRQPYWYDLVLQFAFGSEDKAPKARVEKEKILGGLGGALKAGTVLTAPTFRQVMALAGGERKVVTIAQPIEQIEQQTQALVNQVAATPPQPGVDTPQGGQQ